jgi:hypothetical protein
MPKGSWAGRFFASVAPKSKFQLEVAKWCVENTTRCAKIHHEVMSNLDRDGLRTAYFRLNTPDIGNIGLEEWERMDDMIALAKDYMTPRSMRELKSTIARTILQLPPPLPRASYGAIQGGGYTSSASATHTQAQIEAGSAGEASAGTLSASNHTIA